MHFRKESVIAASAARVFAFHEEPDAIASLQPPWMKSRIVQPPTSLAVGTQVIIEVSFGPLHNRIVAEHIAYEPGRMFRDRMVSGPFAKWEHTHLVEPLTDATCTLVDDIEYELPLGRLGALFGGGIARKQLERLFEFRHDVTRRRCEA